MENQTFQTDYVAPVASAQASDPLGDGISSVELIRVSGSDLEVVNAARVSYGKMSNEISDRDKKLIKFLIAHHHTSPFEHNQLSFRIKAPIYVQRQWIRHRMASYNEISYRYVKAPVEFYVPAYWRYQDKDNRQASTGRFDDPSLIASYKNVIEVAHQAYEKLLEVGVARELARGVLPVCVYTEYIYTVNLHSFMHFIKLRIKADAQWEIRQYAQAMLSMAEKHFPVSISEFKKLYVPEQAQEVAL